MWRNRNLWIIMSGEFIAGLGLWLGIIGNLEFLQRQVPSDFLKSAILFTGPFVGVLLGPLAGRVIDLSSKKKVMNVSGFVRILSVGFMFLALATDSVLWMIGYNIFINGAAAFYFPALSATLPRIVPENRLLQANGLHMNVMTVSRILGTALAGVLLVVTSLFSIYLYTMIAYLFLFVFTLFLSTEEREEKPETSSGKAEGEGARASKPKASGYGFKEVLPVIARNPEVMMALLLTLVPLFFIGSFNLVVLKISEIQHDTAIKGLLYTVEGVSFMAGAFLIKRMSRGKNVIALLLVFAAAVALAHVSLFFANHKAASVLSFALFGWAAGSFYPLTATLFQKSVPKTFHGRFFSFRGMMDRILFQVVLLGTGFLLDLVGFRGMVLSFGGLSVVIVVYFAFKQLRAPLAFRDSDSTVTQSR